MLDFGLQWRVLTEVEKGPIQDLSTAFMRDRIKTINIVCNLLRLVRSFCLAVEICEKKAPSPN
jgi:hypothetical protein